jgi:hydrogenase-4 component B
MDLIGFLLGIAAAGMLWSILTGARAPKLWRAGVLVGAAGGLAAAGVTLGGGGLWDWLSGLRLGGEAVHLRLDALSALFVALLGLIGGAGRCMQASIGPNTTTRTPRRVDAHAGTPCC